MVKCEKRDEILRAALALIAEHGFHGAPMALIAERAGVGAGTIYRYFENKDVLINELFREIEGKIKGRILTGYSAERPIRERFLHLNRELFRYFIGSPLHFRYVEQFHNSPYGVACRRNKILGESDNKDVFQVLFEDGLAQQVMKDLPMLILFSLAFGPLISAVRDHTLGFFDLTDTLIEQITEACWDGVKR
ncbi:TetR/AcrR family transcriptional regulator [Geobacter sp. AOG1]|uniref:TetR/AcrR family transcriptional regulator n=1 Tax=Geobacter sp. AOG1 TaxID=1566346 RepID=UPI001CC75DDE|nr:TetR/AcrR family transcriptional regulator [Geobacter sp. AOG1]GFE56290.1 TetR family transcriptional regulator [Geobacter sp. AOG1]